MPHRLACAFSVTLILSGFGLPGLFGAPSFFVGDALYWGDAQLEDALDAAAQSR